MIRLHLSAALALCVMAGPTFADVLVVTSPANAGDHTLRAALKAAAQSDTPSVITIETDSDIQISETLVYAGSAPLKIFGTGQSITTQQNVTLLALKNGTDLRVSKVAFKGPGGFSINARAVGTPGKGIFVKVRGDQTGTVKLMLEDVTVSGVAGHGIHVADCILADSCVAGEGSHASVSLNLRNVTVRDVGNGSFDADGVRVDERGAGDIIAHIEGSVFVDIGADGVELDEGGSGSVIARVLNTRFDKNGIYCDPQVLRTYLPAPAEREFPKGQLFKSDIAPPGSPDDACFERDVDLYSDGSVEVYEVSIDVDDGFDIDESGPGDINILLIETGITGNFDQGADFDEEDAGSIHLSVIGGGYHRNGDDGIKLSEEDAGNITADLLRTFATGNGGKGISFQEEDAGDVTVNAVRVVTGGNDDSDQTGIEVEQYDNGQGALNVIASDIADGIDADGVRVNAR